MLPGWRRTRTGASNLIFPINIRKWQERKGAKNGQGRKTCAIARSYCAQLICEKKEVRVKIKSLMLLPSVQKRPADFKDWLTDAETTAREFEAVLRRNAKEKTPYSATAGKAYQRAHAACLQCHAKYRDAPQKPRAVLAVAFEGLHHHR